MSRLKIAMSDNQIVMLICCQTQEKAIIGLHKEKIDVSKIADILSIPIDRVKEVIQKWEAEQE